jgi:UPF0176 protein
MNDSLYHIAFYKFAVVSDAEVYAARLRELTAHLKGSILIASEGINGMLAGSTSELDAFEQALQNDSVFERAFNGIVFKRTECVTVPFKRMKVHVKKEIVPLGIPGVDGAKTGIDVSPEEWRELIARDDVVLIDNRNSFEFNLGRFKNAIDPQVINFRDFPKYMEEHTPQWLADGKKIAMYCTGGIRCEKTSAWMKQKGVDIYQLEGGILNYFKVMPDAEKDWDGECFVFDNRVALDTKLRETDTTVDEVYQNEPDGEWRLARAKRLDSA